MAGQVTQRMVAPEAWGHPGAEDTDSAACATQYQPVTVKHASADRGLVS